MLSVVREYKDYSVLGHMDLIARYDEKGVYPFEKIKPIVEEILHLGAYIEETKEMLRKAGYTQFCTYERMSPVFHDL